MYTVEIWKNSMAESGVKGAIWVAIIGGIFGVINVIAPKLLEKPPTKEPDPTTKSSTQYERPVNPPQQRSDKTALPSNNGPTEPPEDFILSGTVTDEDTGASVSQALISLDRRTETTLSDDNGNFYLRISLVDQSLKSVGVRLRISKASYEQFNEIIHLPVGPLALQLKKYR